MFSVWSVCLSVCLSVGLLANLWTDFDEIFGGVEHGSRTKWYNFGGDPDHASDPGVQSPKSGSSGSAEVCALWVQLSCFCMISVSAEILSVAIQTERLMLKIWPWVTLPTLHDPDFAARCTIVQSAVLRSHAVCPSVYSSVCDVGGSWPHRLKTLETNCENN